MQSIRDDIVEQLRKVPETRLQEVLRFIATVSHPAQKDTQMESRLLAQEVEEFFQEPPTMDARNALGELCTGIFESDENVARNHDAFLYDR